MAAVAVAAVAGLSSSEPGPQAVSVMTAARTIVADLVTRLRDAFMAMF